MTMAEQVQEWSRNTLSGHLNIHFELVEPHRVIGTMPVESYTCQPAGYLHGGASVALAETLASVGATLNVDHERQTVFGMEINANHIRRKREGIVRGEATLLHRGRSTMVWQIFIRDEAHQLICVSRCTIAVVTKTD